MKNISITIFTLISFFFLSCQQSASKKVNKSKAKITSTSNTQTNVNAPVMTFDRVSLDFGTSKEGETVETEFSFTNTGKSDLTTSLSKFESFNSITLLIIKPTPLVEHH